MHYINARKDIKIEGNLIENSKRMPTLVDLRYSQFEDINSVLELLEIEVRKNEINSFQKIHRVISTTAQFKGYREVY